MGVAPAEDGEFRTRPPGIFGGNMDVRELCTGATLYLPVLNRGALFSAGDAHAAQGDGEVCINGIECPADVTLRFQVHKQRALPGPMVETPAARKLESDAEAGEWIVVESSSDAVGAARAATSRMIDLLADRWGFSAVHAYLLVQRGDESAVQPGCERADLHGFGGDLEADTSGKETFLIWWRRLQPVGFRHCTGKKTHRLKPVLLKRTHMLINDPEIVAELQALYPKYEAALMANDAETLTQMFWASPHAMRFGVTENLYGIEEIDAFRKGRSPANLARTVRRLDIVTFGRDFGSITLEFERTVNGKTISGRQSQVWVRFPEGWRIVSAHVSVLP